MSEQKKFYRYIDGRDAFFWAKKNAILWNRVKIENRAVLLSCIVASIDDLQRWSAHWPTDGTSSQPLKKRDRQCAVQKRRRRGVIMKMTSEAPDSD